MPSTPHALGNVSKIESHRIARHASHLSLGSFADVERRRRRAGPEHFRSLNTAVHSGVCRRGPRSPRVGGIWAASPPLSRASPGAGRVEGGRRLRSLAGGGCTLAARGLGRGGRRTSTGRDSSRGRDVPDESRGRGIPTGRGGPRGVGGGPGHSARDGAAYRLRELPPAAHGPANPLELAGPAALGESPGTGLLAAVGAIRSPASGDARRPLAPPGPASAPHPPLPAPAPAPSGPRKHGREQKAPPAGAPAPWVRPVAISPGPRPRGRPRPHGPREVVGGGEGACEPGGAGESAPGGGCPAPPPTSLSAAPPPSRSALRRFLASLGKHGVPQHLPGERINPAFIRPPRLSAATPSPLFVADSRTCWRQETRPRASSAARARGKARSSSRRRPPSFPSSSTGTD